MSVGYALEKEKITAAFSYDSLFPSTKKTRPEKIWAGLKAKEP
jgi:hypothetical protein